MMASQVQPRKITDGFTIASRAAPSRASRQQLSAAARLQGGGAALGSLANPRCFVIPPADSVPFLALRQQLQMAERALPTEPPAERDRVEGFASRCSVRKHGGAVSATMHIAKAKIIASLTDHQMDRSSPCRHSIETEPRFTTR
jgi:hypothetical protein